MSVGYFQQPLHLHSNEDSPVSESQATMLRSPSDFLDLNLPISEALGDLGKGESELGLLPPFTWLPAGETPTANESLSHP